MIIPSLIILVVSMLSIFFMSLWQLRKKTDAGFVKFVRFIIISAILAVGVIVYSILGFLTWKHRTVVELVLFGVSSIIAFLIFYICLFDINEGDFVRNKIPSNKKQQYWK